jgi:transposase
MMEKQIEAINAEVEERMRPFQPALDLMDQIPGIAQHGAEQIIAEVGVDISRFPTPGPFASWARSVLEPTRAPANVVSRGLGTVTPRSARR